MLNMKDEYLAQERYADLRREAEAHNAAARLRQQERTDEPGSRSQCDDVRRLSAGRRRPR